MDLTNEKLVKYFDILLKNKRAKVSLNHYKAHGKYLTEAYLLGNVSLSKEEKTKYAEIFYSNHLDLLTQDEQTELPATEAPTEAPSTEAPKS